MIVMSMSQAYYLSAGRFAILNYKGCVYLLKIWLLIKIKINIKTNIVVIGIRSHTTCDLMSQTVFFSSLMCLTQQYNFAIVLYVRANVMCYL